MKSKFKNDLLLTGAILLIALVAFAVFKLSAKGGSTVNVSVDGKTMKKFSLYTDTVYKIKTGENINTLVIKDGKAYVKFANCPDKICEHHREIANIGETIVCLPHKVVISIEGEE